MTLRLDRVFVDAGFFIARYNRRDQHHQQARALAAEIVHARELWTTDAVLLEVTATMARPSSRQMAARIWDQFHDGDERCRSVVASASQLAEAMSQY